MPSISPHCHELRIDDSEADKQWRIIYRIDSDAIVIADVFQKNTQKTPKRGWEMPQTFWNFQPKKLLLLK